MRLIGSLHSTSEASVFQKFCKTKGIEILTESAPDEKLVQVWVIHEEDTEKAQDLLETFQKDPSLPEYYVSACSSEELIENEYEVSQDPNVVKRARWPYLTWLWILVSSFLFMVQMSQLASQVKTQGTIALEVSLPPINEALFFDMPEGFEKLQAFVQKYQIKNQQQIANLSPELQQTWQDLKSQSYFHGFLDMLEDPSYKESYLKLKPELFGKIRQGQVYRLFTPVLLHGSVLHILFNMLWLFVLLKQVELKLGVFKTLLLLVFLSIIPNVAQYLVSGPFFLGASGIVVGLAGFIWARQKKAPWEGYLLAKPIIYFIAIYILALAALSLGIFVFNVLSLKDVSFGIANTAHVTGGVVGFFLGRWRFFSRT